MSQRPGELFPLDSALRGIRERFSDAVIDADRTSLRERTVVVPAARLAEVTRAVSREWGGAFVTLFGLDERAVHGRFRLHVSFSMAPGNLSFPGLFLPVRTEAAIPSALVSSPEFTGTNLPACWRWSG